jgi:hypothetical protein
MAELILGRILFGLIFGVGVFVITVKSAQLGIRIVGDEMGGLLAYFPGMAWIVAAYILVEVFGLN